MLKIGEKIFFFRGEWARAEHGHADQRRDGGDRLRHQPPPQPHHQGVHIGHLHRKNGKKMKIRYEVFHWHVNIVHLHKKGLQKLEIENPPNFTEGG